jgi:hypothetical protein
MDSENILKIKVKLFEKNVMLSFKKISDSKIRSFKEDTKCDDFDISIDFKTLYLENDLSTFIEIAAKLKTDFSQNYSYIIKSCDVDINHENPKWNRYTFHCIAVGWSKGEYLYLVADCDYYGEYDVYELIDNV